MVGVGGIVLQGRYDEFPPNFFSDGVGDSFADSFDKFPVVFIAELWDFGDKFFPFAGFEFVLFGIE